MRSLPSIAAAIMEYEAGELDADQTIGLFQILIDSGVIRSLQGSYQRQALELVASGLCVPPNANYRPRRREVN